MLVYAIENEVPEPDPLSPTLLVDLVCAARHVCACLEALLRLVAAFSLLAPRFPSPKGGGPKLVLEDRSALMLVRL